MTENRYIGIFLKAELEEPVLIDYRCIPTPDTSAAYTFKKKKKLAIQTTYPLDTPRCPMMWEYPLCAVIIINK